MRSVGIAVVVGLVALNGGCVVRARGEAAPAAYNAQPAAYNAQPAYHPSPATAPANPPPNAGEPATWGVPLAATWTLREREQWKALSDSVTGGGSITAGGASSALEIANRVCATQFQGGFVFDTFHGHFTPGASFGGDSYERYLDAPIEALHDLCERGPMQRDAVRQKIRRVEIRWGGNGRSSFTVAGGTLFATVGPIAEEVRRGWDAAQFRTAIATGLPNML